MKSTFILALIPSLFLATAAVASDQDEGLEKTLRATINERHVDVDVHQGIVKLEGTVPTPAERERVESIVRSTPGVVGLKDELKVSNPGPVGTTVVTAPVATAPVTIPIYRTVPPDMTVVVPVPERPAAVVVPDYPALKVQAWTTDDAAAASRIANDIRFGAVPTTGLENMSIAVRNGNVWLRGLAASQEQHDALVRSIQSAGGVRAIYDQTQIRR
jgi:osmotically-inducible protein OsmY